MNDRSMRLVYRVAMIGWLGFSFGDDALGGNDCGKVVRVSASESFVVRSYLGGPDAQEMLRHCEELRRKLEQTWLGEDGDVPWQPRCAVILHGSRPAYAAAVGRGSENTTGCSMMQFSRGRLVCRRIDLLVDARNHATALAHELTHVVLWGHFGRPLPHWADEGMAVLADSTEKQSLYQRELHAAFRSDALLPTHKLLSLQQLASSNERSVFYGQSVSLVHFLVERESPGRFVEFLEQAIEVGYDRALREVYAIESVADLERLWRNTELAGSPAAPP
jgi:hypothetical protein